GSKGMTPLTQAVESDDQTIADLLLNDPNKKANIDAPDTNLRTPLFVAVEIDNDNMVDFLLARNADPKIPAKKQVTPLMKASKNIADKLIATKKVDFDATDEENQTALLTKYLQGKNIQVDTLLPVTSNVDQKGGQFERNLL